jgi:hypothetical protein
MEMAYTHLPRVNGGIEDERRSNVMSDLAKFVMALIGLLAMAIVASRQLFLFAVFRNPLGFLDSQAGRSHLWLSVGAGIAGCIAGGLMFHFFARHEKNKWSKVGMTPTGPLFTSIPNSPASAPFDPIRWALANPWLTEGQPDDRTPMDGSVTDSGQTPSGQRSFARRTHQLMFKKWSQERHD